jgi:hypothetical protein
MPVTPDGDPIVLTLTGTAAPTTAGNATGKAESCAQYPVVSYTTIPGQVRPAAGTYLVCVSAEVSITAVAAAATQAPHAATMPPTSTGGSSSNTGPGSAIWLLPISLILGACSALFLNLRRNRGL